MRQKPQPEFDSPSPYIPFGRCRAWANRPTKTKQQNKTMKNIKAVNPPEECDLCSGNLKQDPTFYDGSVKGGSWAWMCKHCFLTHGSGLGIGRGQEFDSATDEKTNG